MEHIFGEQLELGLDYIKILLEKYFEQKKLSKLYIIEALILLAFNTGCVEDEIISEKILKELYNSKIICEDDIEIFNI
jgi:hypothetical protein